MNAFNHASGFAYGLNWSETTQVTTLYKFLRFLRKLRAQRFLSFKHCVCGHTSATPCAGDDQRKTWKSRFSSTTLVLGIELGRGTGWLVLGIELGRDTRWLVLGIELGS